MKSSFMTAGNTTYKTIDQGLNELEQDMLLQELKIDHRRSGVELRIAAKKRARRVKLMWLLDDLRFFSWAGGIVILFFLIFVITQF
ncbi:hypothetical protein [Paenibacillus sp. FSL L8-0709]|uniref:hypothetical protein n=1 Tax=Paenibacillus sp. FSL L8-0709 TaxID=2975312 RepID=UPI0030FBE801